MTRTYTDNNYRKFTANSNAMGLDLRVILNSSGYLELADAEDRELGTLMEESVGNLAESVTVRLRNTAGTCAGVASGAITINDYVYGADGGKVSATENGNLIGISLTAATDGGRVEFLRLAQTEDPIDGGLEIDEDFIGDWPASGTALSGQGRYSWTKTETNGLGVTSNDQSNGVLKFAFDAAAEAATASLYFANSPLSPASGIVEFIVGIFDIGDDAALDIDFGVGDGVHATDFESVSEYAAFHLDGNDLSLKVHTDDGTTDSAITDTTVDLVDNTYYAFKIDWTDPTDVKFYYRAIGAAQWTRLLSGTTFDVSGAVANWTPLVMVEKTSNDTTADVRVDRVRAKSTRA